MDLKIDINGDLYTIEFDIVEWLKEKNQEEKPQLGIPLQNLLDKSPPDMQ